jgi:hypothetical protein
MDDYGVFRVSRPGDGWWGGGEVTDELGARYRQSSYWTMEDLKKEEAESEWRW